MTPRNALCAAGLLAALAGCIDPDLPPVDPSTRFAGLWRGDTVVEIDGQPANSPGAFTRILAVAADAIYIGNVCGDGSGPYALVSRDGSFTIGAVRCPSAVIGSCSAVTLEYAKGGTGALVDDRITMTMTGTLSTCGTQSLVKFQFSGLRDAP